MTTTSTDIAARLYTETFANGGSTVSPDSPDAPAPTTGYVVALAGAEKIVPMEHLTMAEIESYMSENATEIDHTPGVFVGTWVDDGQVYLDLSTVIADKATALATGVANAQLAVFHLDSLTVVTL